MSSTRDYLDYLNNHIDIAPANSQEELDAAQLIQGLMDEHGLDTTIQEFDTPGSGEVPHDVLYIVLLVGMVLSGILGSPVAVIGRLLVLASVVLLALRFGGYDLLGSLGPKARSQNVVGVHRASGPLVVKGNRPIVVVAHYDTPNESLLYGKGGLLPAVRRLSFILVAVVTLCMVLQIIPLPNAVRHVFWIIGILAALPLLIIGIADIYEKFAPCTTGANDNKSSVAALMGLMDMVRPGNDDAKQWVVDHPFEETEPQQTEPESDEELAGEYAEMDEAAIAADQSLEQIPVAQPEENEAVADEVPQDEGGLFGKMRSGAEGLFGRKHPEEEEGLEHEFVPEVPSVVAASRDEDPQPATVPVQPAEPVYDEQPAYEPADATVDEPQPRVVAEEATPVQQVAYQQPAPAPAAQAPQRNVRRGLDFIESLQILPSDCEIVYERPPRPEVDLSNLPEVPEMPEFRVEDFYNRDEFKSEVEEKLEEQEREEQDELHSGYIPSFIERRAAQKAQRDAQNAQYNNELENTNSFQAVDEQEEEGPYVPQVDEAYRSDADEESATEEDVQVAEPEGEEFDPLDEDDEYADEPTDNGFASKLKRVFASLKERFSKPDSVSGNTEQFDALSDEDLEDYEEVDQTETAEPVDEQEYSEELETETPAEPDAESPAPEVQSEAVSTMPRFDDADTTGSLIEGDLSGLDTAEEETGPDVAANPAPVDDPKWGVSEYAPAAPQGVAQRAMLFDLPDPSAAPNDSLAPDDQDGDGAIGSREPIGFVTAENGFEYDENDEPARGKKGSWKGGATDRYDVRPEATVAEDGYVPEDQELRQEDLREAILGMGDDELVAHDIWFVALGASTLRHAGMREFLADFKKSIRGAFVINLDSVGAGDLAVLTAEGSTDTRHSDRRLIKLIGTTAAALHIRMDKRRYDWAETDATPAMEQSLRAVTIMGLDDKGMPALSHTAEDVPENVNANQVVSVAQLVAELIRRS